MRPRPWTRTEDAELRRLATDGFNCAEIAERIGRTRSAVLNRRNNLLIKRYRKQPPGRPEKIEELLRANPGRTDTSIAAETGCSRMTVNRARKALGLPGLTREEWTAVAARTYAAYRAEHPNEPTRCERLILAVLAEGPLTPGEITARVGSSRNSVYLQLYSMRRKGLAYAEGLGGRGGTQWCALGWWLTHNEGLVWMVANRVHRKNYWCDPEDLAGEFRLAVAKCVRAFRPGGAKFSTYAVVGAERTVMHWAALQRTRGVYVPQHKRFVYAACPLVTAIVATDDRGRSRDLPIPAPPADRAPVPDSTFWDKAVAGLAAVDSRLPQVILGCYRDNKTMAEVGDEMGCSRGRVEQLLRRAEQLIRQKRSLDEFTAA